MSAPSNHYDTEIKNLIDSNWGDFGEVAHNKVGHLANKYVLFRRLSYFALVCLVVGGLLITRGEEGSVLELIGEYYGLSFGWLATLYIFGWALGFFAVYIWYRWNEINKEFNQLLNPIVFKKAFSVIGFAGHYMTGESLPHDTSIVALLDHSELITENRNRYQIDDMVSGESQGRSVFVAELDVKNVTGSGKHKSTKNIFHGVLIAHDLPRALTGKTFITTEGDRRGFGKISLWRRLFKSQETPKETVLEWNDFENKLHVATTNETEARYVLTPDLMQSLFDWWSIRKGKIRVSFIDNRMYVLYSDRHVKLGSTALSIKEKDLKKYILEVARPLWHTKKLMECTEVRFRE